MRNRFKPGATGILAGLFMTLAAGLPVRSAATAAAENMETGKPARVVDAQADGVIREMTDLIRNAKSFTLDLDMVMNTQMQGVKQEMLTVFGVAMQRPNLFAMVLKEGLMGSTVVCDGKKLYTCMPMLKRYTESAAPADLSAMMPGSGANPMGSMSGSMGGGVLGALLAANPREALLDGVAVVKYAGLEKLGDAECHHLKFTQEQFDWDLWVQAGNLPVIRRMAMDMTKVTAKAMAAAKASEGMGEMFKNMKITLTMNFKNWTLNTDLPGGRFVFTPPAGAKKNESLPDGQGSDEEPNPLVGKPAPAFKLDGLDGGALDLAAKKGTNIVILDFWATWCGPCVRTLPILAEVAQDYRDKGVVLYAVNQKEEPAAVRSFLEKKNLAVTVALDRKGEVGALYGVEGIPQTVIIDTRGVVQAVHVGLSPNLKSRLAGELDMILAGKSIAAKPAGKEPELKGLESAWAVAGRWNGVAADLGGGGAYVLAMDGACARVNAEGKVERQFKIQPAGPTLRAANLMGDKGSELLTFRPWGESVRASDTSGNTLWTYTEGQGVDDVWAADLDGDGFDEVIIGYNGAGGVHVLDNQGKLLWKYGKLANVWHVCAGDLDGDGAVEVVTTSAQGKAHVFDADGNKLRDVKPACYANMVRVARPSAKDKALMMVVGGTSPEQELVLVGLNAEGAEKWRANLKSENGNSIDSAQAAADEPWLAVMVRGGGLRIVDAGSGKIVGEASGAKGRTANVAWMAQPAKRAPLVLVTTSRELIAYRMTNFN